MKKLIQKLLRESLLREEMVSDISNLGLYHNPDYNMIGIYDPQIMSQALEDYDYDKQLESVKGGVNYRYNEKYDSYEIDSISAEKGYGPILYMILMTFAGDNGLMASRVRNQVSNDAKNVWQNFYDGKGSQYVEAIPLDSEHHDEDSLRHKYVIKTPVDTSKSVAINDEILSNDPYGEKDGGIAEAIESYIRNDMRDIYSEQETSSSDPLVLNIVKNPEAAPNMGSTYGQDVEPHGTYVLASDNPLEGWLSGKAILNKPLYIDVDDDNQIQYKYDLAKEYGAKGKRLTNKLMNQGYDAIITRHTKYNDTGEIVLLPNARFNMN